MIITRLLAFLLVAAVVPAWAGGPPPFVRKGTFQRTCKGGTNRGTACTDDSQCPGSTCELVLERKTLNATLTLIVDDNVSKFNHGEDVSNVVAATLLVEVRVAGVTHLLAQTYENLTGSDFATLVANLQGGEFVGDTQDPVTEATLNGVASTDTGDEGVLARFTLQSADGQLANQLRTVAGATGVPVVIGVPRRFEQVQHTDRGADGLASVVRIKVKVGFGFPAP